MSIERTFELLQCIYGDKVKRYNNLSNVFYILIDRQQINFCSYDGTIGRLSSEYKLYYRPYWNSIEIICGTNRFRIHDVFRAYESNYLDYNAQQLQFITKNHPINRIEEFFTPNIQYNPKNYPLSKKSKIKNINEMLWNIIKKDICNKYILLRQMVYGDIANFITEKNYLLVMGK